ncbi:MAG TPA: RNA-binding domain-containing protein [Candidatus Binatia bacterium]|nr:RNA-binding domain-containing protein [Candidatus Binatia bacterium]
MQGEIGGKAKAMMVTRSRLHAVRYKLAVDRYLAERGYPFKALVAFSGTVQDGGQAYTEVNMNGFPEAQTAKTFERPEYRFLIVANRFQTGFDQPLLHTVYVDKKLGGANAVQTLSRLNRTHPEKKGTMVLDFANEADGVPQHRGRDLLIGVADDGSVVGIERDRLESDDKFMRHLAQVVRNGLGDRASTCIDPKTQIVDGRTVCVVSCQRSPEPVFLKWKGMEAAAEGDFFVRSGPGTAKLPPESAREYIRTRFGTPGDDRTSDPAPKTAV